MRSDGERLGIHRDLVEVGRDGFASRGRRPRDEPVTTDAPIAAVHLRLCHGAVARDQVAVDVQLHAVAAERPDDVVPLVVAVARGTVDREARAHVGAHAEVDLPGVVHVEVPVVAVRGAPRRCCCRRSRGSCRRSSSTSAPTLRARSVCGPGCQYGDAPWTVAVLVVPGKFVAGSVSFSNAPGTLRLFALFSVRSFEPARSNAVVPLASPMRHCQSGVSARTLAA